MVVHRVVIFFFYKQKTAYDMSISDLSSDVCSSDLSWLRSAGLVHLGRPRTRRRATVQLDGSVHQGVGVGPRPAVGPVLPASVPTRPARPELGQPPIGNGACRDRVV